MVVGFSQSSNDPKKASMSTTNTVSYLLEIVSDTICPWCYIGKRRLEAALDLLGDAATLDVRWRPFELNPDMPREGVERRAYRSRKFGSWERSQQLDAQVKAVGARDGLDFHHERMARTPNTLASHALVRLAGEAGAQNATVEALFKAYFTDGLDVGNPDVLAEIGVACGLDRIQVAAALNDDKLRADIKSEAQSFVQGGISGVPTVMLNRYVLFAGAQAPELIAKALRRAAAHEEVVAASTKAALHA